MFNSFASSLWMLPFSKYCQAESKYWKHLSGGIKKNPHTYQCEEPEFHSNYSGWPTNVVNIEIPSMNRKDFKFIIFQNRVLSCSRCSFCVSNWKDMMPIHPFQKLVNPTILAWNVDSLLSYPSQRVKYQMVPSSRQQKTMTQTARGSCTSYRSEYFLILFYYQGTHTSIVPLEEVVFVKQFTLFLFQHSPS